jgi:hypothetical protein
MSGQFWSWILTAIGLAGFFLAGRKVWWCWYINIFNQAIWLAYSVVTHQWGFLVGVVAYTIVFTKNAVKWTKERNQYPLPNERIGEITGVSISSDGVLKAVMKVDRSETGDVIWKALGGKPRKTDT